MNARTRTLVAATLLLGIVSGPAVAQAAPRQVAVPARAPVSAPVYSHAPDAKALTEALEGVGAHDKDATAALVRIGGSSGGWQGAFGVADVGSGRPALEQGRFRAGSVTKTFTAAVVLQLAAEGKLDLDEPVQQYLPGTFPDRFEPVSVRQLLNHTSGIKPADGPGDDFEAQWRHRFDVVDPHDQIAGALAQGPEFVPGRAQHYLNINYTVLGVLIEKLTGTTYEEQVDRRILRPLGLRQTSFPGRTQTRMAGPYNHGYQAVPRPDGSTELRDVSVWNSSDRWAAGDIISTTADLERFTVALFSGRVVPRAQLEEMFTVPAVKDIETGKKAVLTAGLSRIVMPDGTELWGKTGSRLGYSTGMGAARDLSRTLVYSVNSTDAKGENTNPVIDRLVLAALDRWQS
ncbi:serine hydrolase domain-containing protein [Streptomyces sp. NBC_00539]|uniref:serine hydrolase domain-containing protein n=1 Tax=Streptomyces sp. NBC_00539 TaxID=2975770 RepID=UPI002E801BFB|nr:serine hydrolase domain-containing protein [Streptomyces sp. NBC_00539]WUC64393.1 beta-lactamase family protein [Streptomyces sp. NBC_00539]